jgi:hypothetical protein
MLPVCQDTLSGAERESANAAAGAASWSLSARFELHWATVSEHGGAAGSLENGFLRSRVQFVNLLDRVPLRPMASSSRRRAQGRPRSGPVGRGIHPRAAVYTAGTVEQREVLERAKALVVDRTQSLIPDRYSWAAWRQHDYYIVRSCGISREIRDILMRGQADRAARNPDLPASCPSP